MSFGPELTVGYANPKPGKIESVRMASFTASDAQPLFPFPNDDPTLPFVVPVANFLRAKTPVGYMHVRILPAGVVAWGIWDASRLLGFVELARKEGTDDVVSLSIVLEPNARGKGAGPLAVAGALRFAFAPNQLARVINGFSTLGAVAVETVIHPDNQTSRDMCEALGFEEDGERMLPSRSRWPKFKLSAPPDHNYHPEGILFD